MSDLPDGVYTRDFQINLITHLARDEAFFQDNQSHLRIPDFEVPGCRLLFEILVEYFAKYRKLPDFTTLMMEVTRKNKNNDGSTQTVVPPEQTEVLIYALSQIGNPTTILNTLYYRDQLPGYLKSIRVAQAIREVGGVTGNANDLINRMLQINQDIANTNDVEFVDITANPKLAKSYAEIARIPTTCLPKLDDFLAGGLGLQEMGLIVAPIGLGKTTAQLNLLHGAVFAGHRGLFISLENSMQQIHQRYLAIAGHIKIGAFDKPTEEWTKEDKYKMQLLLDPTKNKWFGHETVIEPKRRFTVEDIEQSILRWRDRVYRAGGNPDECKIVFVDWLDLLEPSGPGISAKDRDDTLFMKTSNNMALMGDRQNVALWTATQANRDGMSKSRLAMTNTAQAIHKNDAVDLAIGITARDHDVQEVISENTRITVEKTECNRFLNASIMKLRRGNPGATFTFYQGPTLKFWDRKQEEIEATKALNDGRVEEVLMKRY